MQDKVVIKAPAKLNLFLRIIGQKKNGYHIVRTGITFLDLYDVINISVNDISNLSYSGPFRPSSSIYENDIIIKVLNNISIKKKLKINIKIKKNIPWQAGLGSASTDAASLLKGLQTLGLIKNVDSQLLNKIGTDVPVCYYCQNCLVTGIGDRISTDVQFSKYYFLLVKPSVHLSTSLMYQKVKKYLKFEKKNTKELYSILINEDDKGNDFEKIIKKEYKEISELLIFLSHLDGVIFSRMTGSGSCCYAAFEKKEIAKKALEITSKKYNNYWIYLAENRIINN